MEFATRRLERCAFDLSRATREWGQPVALRYIQRTQLLIAANTLDEVQRVRSLRLHPLSGNRDGQWAMTLMGRWRLILELIDRETIRIREVSAHYGD